ncbi:hypothetical protein D3C85_14740 [compost metagenome]
MSPNRTEAQLLRTKILNEVNKVINNTCQLHKGFLSKFGRCYYVVTLSDMKNIKVRILATEAPLDPAKRVLLANNELYAQSSYYGTVQYDSQRCRFKRQTRIKESVTYAEGQLLLEIRLKDMTKSFTNKDVRKAFSHYKDEVSNGQRSLF